MKIKTCPFCGTTEDEGYLKVEDVASVNLPSYYAVYCGNCGSTGAGESIKWTGSSLEVDREIAKKNAIKLWNRRAKKG